MSTQSKVIVVTGAATGFGRLAATLLAQAGHIVYASMRGVEGRYAGAAQELRALAGEQIIQLIPLELDVLSESSAKAAADQVIAEQGRVDVVINNAAMLMIGVTEAFTPEQLLRIFDTNTVSWLRVNRAFLPQMRKQGDGLLLYIGSVTSRILSPFQGPYVASKAAGDALAETMHYENSRYGIDTVIVQPGAYTAGTNHFAGAQLAEDEAVSAQYDRINDLPPKLAARLDSLATPGARTDVGEVAEAVRDVIATPKGQRPFRIVVDPQHHGAAEVNEVSVRMQRDFMERFGIADLMTVAS
ncbi:MULTISPECIES: SDR family oxidoreductase [unclassified Sphingomonas]|uniref:SDR family oxidoreductase n=1 Tax=Novosphingobium rhizosphaerae TaxID=1551649 RepID=UPI0015C6CF77